MKFKSVKYLFRHYIAAPSMRMLNPRAYYTLWYYSVRRRKPDFKKPTDLSEHLIARIISGGMDKYSVYTDKLKVRDYISDKGYGGILPRIYDVCETVDEIDIGKYPEQFVLKTNHGCGGHIICRDKSSLDIAQSRNSLEVYLKSSYNNKFEPHYALIEPRVYCEEYLDNKSGGLPVDYKFHCFYGVPEFVLVCSEREKELKLTTYDLNWERLYYLKGSFESGLDIPRPSLLGRMTEIARKLSEDFEFVRVDLYQLGERVVFGELTFTPASGIFEYYTDEAVKKLGKLMHDPSDCRAKI